MLLQPYLLLGDEVKTIGLELEALDLARHDELVAASKLEGPALRRFLETQSDDGRPLTSGEWQRLERRLERVRELDAPSVIVRPLEIELGRMAFFRTLADRDDPELATYKGMLPLLARQDRMTVSRRVFESLLWTLVPTVRREKRAFVNLPDWVKLDREISASEHPAVLNASKGFCALAGAVRIEGLEASPYGMLQHVPNVARPEHLPELQAALEAALPSDLAALLSEWRETFPSAYHEIKMRFALTDLESRETQAFADELSREADWHFAHAMSEMHTPGRSSARSGCAPLDAAGPSRRRTAWTRDDGHEEVSPESRGSGGLAQTDVRIDSGSAPKFRRHQRRERFTATRRLSEAVTRTSLVA